MDLTLNNMMELIIGLAVFVVLFSIILSVWNPFVSKQSLQELILDKVNERIAFIEKDTCRDVLFNDEFNLVVYTQDHPNFPLACSKSSPCGCVSFKEQPKNLGCKNLALKNKCDDTDLCYEEMQELKVIKRTLKLCADERGQLKYG